MKGNVGARTSIYQTRLPHQRKLERAARTVDLSKEAKVRLTWLTHYKRNKNATITSRRFGISRSTLYKWTCRYDGRVREASRTSLVRRREEGGPPSPGRP